MKDRNRPARFVGLSLLFMMALASFALTGCAQKMTPEDWLSKFQPAFTVKFCETGGYLGECFDVSAEECETKTMSAVRVCFAGAREEMSENMTGSGGEWGGEIGTCAGDAFERVLRDRKFEKEICKDPSAWM